MPWRVTLSTIFCLMNALLFIEANLLTSHHVDFPSYIYLLLSRLFRLTTRKIACRYRNKVAKSNKDQLKMTLLKSYWIDSSSLVLSFVKNCDIFRAYFASLTVTDILWLMCRMNCVLEIYFGSAKLETFQIFSIQFWNACMIRIFCLHNVPILCGNFL